MWGARDPEGWTRLGLRECVRDMEVTGRAGGRHGRTQHGGVEGSAAKWTRRGLF